MGLVDACQTKDVDALLFGAQVVYKRLHLQVGGWGGAGLEAEATVALGVGGVQASAHAPTGGWFPMVGMAGRWVGDRCGRFDAMG